MHVKDIARSRLSRVEVGEPPAPPADGREDPRPLVSVVIPAYNEAAIIGQNLAALCAYLDGHGARFRWEVVVVDDGSADGTGAAAERVASEWPSVRVIRHPVNLKLGQALRTGFAHCRGDCVVVLDVDLSYAPEHVGALVSALLDTRADMVVASPYMKGGRVSAVPWLRRLLSRWANRFLAYLSGHGRLHTITGMVRAYDRAFLDSLDLKASGVEINAEIIYKGMVLGGRIIEIPAHLDWSLQNAVGRQRRSSFRVYRGFVTYLLSGFIFRPVMFFLLPGLLLQVVALYMLAWIFLHVRDVYPTVVVTGTYFDDRFSTAVATVFQQRPHAFFVAGVTLLASLQAIGLGVLALQNKSYFEELFHISSTIRRTSERTRG